MKASLFILLIAVGLCSARPKFGHGYPKFWYEDELINNEAPDEDEGTDEPAEEATEEEATEEAKEKEEATEEAKEEATKEAEEKEEATEEAKEEATEKAEEEATEEAKEEATEEAKEKEEATEEAKEEATEEAKEKEEATEEEATEEAKEKEEATEEAKEEATEEAKEKEEATEEAEEEATEEAEEKEEATKEAEEEATEVAVAEQTTGEISAAWLFLGNWEEEEKGEVTAGKDVEIVYDGSRLPSRDTRYGQRAWSISVKYKFSEDGLIHSEELDGPEMIEGVETMTKSIFVPFGATTLTVWFVHWGYYSSYSYDSDHGKNYHAQVSESAEPTIVFDSGSWLETVHGDLEKGGKFNVYYDFARLDDDDEVIHAVAKFYDDSEYTHELKGPIAGSRYLVTTYTIPQEAEKVILWFYTGQDDEREYDSDYGRNYVFPLKEESESQNEAVGA